MSEPSRRGITGMSSSAGERERMFAGQRYGERVETGGMRGTGGTRRPGTRQQDSLAESRIHRPGWEPWWGEGVVTNNRQQPSTVRNA